MKREMALSVRHKAVGLECVRLMRERAGMQLVRYCQSDGQAHALLMYCSGLLEKREWKEISFEPPCVLRLKNGSAVVFRDAGFRAEMVEEATA